MKISFTSLTAWAIVILLSSCGQRLYTGKELRTQKVPDILKSRTWTLKQISIVSPDTVYHLYQLYDPNLCPFTFQFGNKGKLKMNFKSVERHGTYLIDGDKFKHFYIGWYMKIVWIDPVCKITPMHLSYVFQGLFQYKIDGNTLIMKNKSGDEFTLTAN